MTKQEYLAMLLKYIPGFREWMDKNHPEEVTKDLFDLLKI